MKTNKQANREWGKQTMHIAARLFMLFFKRLFPIRHSEMISLKFLRKIMIIERLYSTITAHNFCIIEIIRTLTRADLFIFPIAPHKLMKLKFVCVRQTAGK